MIFGAKDVLEGLGEGEDGNCCLALSHLITVYKKAIIQELLRDLY